MLKKILKERIPNIHDLRNKYQLGFLGEHLLAPHLWHFHRKDVARALAIGVFIGLTPLPGHMIIISCIVIFLYPANLPIALVAPWFNNPATFVPLYYYEYKFGIWILGWQEGHFHIAWSLRWFAKEFINIWVPTLLASLIIGIILATLVYWLVLLLWKMAIIYAWKNRHKANKKN